MDRAVLVRGGQALAVGAEGDCKNRTGMALDGEQLLAGRVVPDPHCLVPARRSQALAVRAERHARGATCMALESVELLPGHAVPDLHGLVSASRRQAPA